MLCVFRRKHNVSSYLSPICFCGISISNTITFIIPFNSRMILQVVYLALGFFSLDAQAQWLSIYLIVGLTGQQIRIRIRSFPISQAMHLRIKNSPLKSTNVNPMPFRTILQFYKCVISSETSLWARLSVVRVACDGQLISSNDILWQWSILQGFP